MSLLLQQGADVHAKDKGGLVPLHNACSYGHFEVSSKIKYISILFGIIVYHLLAFIEGILLPRCFVIEVIKFSTSRPKGLLIN